MKGKLTPKQAMFVSEYLIDKNATQAATRAGYSAKCAQEQGSYLLSKPMIREQVDAGLEKQKKDAELRAAKRGITKERWLKELELIGFANYDDFAQMVDGDLTIRDTKEHKRAQGRVIKKISQSKSRSDSTEGSSESLSQSIELHDKTKALVTIGQAFGWLTQKVEHSGSVTLEELVAGSREEKK